MSEPDLTIDDLARGAGIPSRTVRFYQTRGLLPRPEMRGRVAHYGPAHVERLRRIAQLQDRGLKIKAIHELLGRVERGETRLEEWLGLEDRLREPWTGDESRIVNGAELASLAGDLRPGRLAELIRHGLVTRRGGSFLIPSLALLTLAIRLAITPSVAGRFVADGTIDPAFDPLTKLCGAFFPAFILIASGSIVALGAAIVAGGSLGEPLGWACLAAGLAIGASFVVIGDTLPAFVYLPTAAVGIAMLLSTR
jgi:DNA-binding transcriptional MerR regulator